MAHYIFNLTSVDVPTASTLVGTGRWTVRPDEPLGEALAAGDLALVYLAAPHRVFTGRAELGTGVRDGEVALTQIEEWDPPVSMESVLARIERSGGARADFDSGIVRITQGEYEAAIAGRPRPGPHAEAE